MADFVDFRLVFYFASLTFPSFAIVVPFEAL